MTILDAVLAVLDVKIAALLPHLNERQRRLFLAAEAGALGHGGIAAVARLAEVSESTIARGRAELAGGAPVLGRVRRAGGGRKLATERDPGLRPALQALIEPREAGCPGSALRWTPCSIEGGADRHVKIRRGVGNSWPHVRFDRAVGGAAGSRH